VDRARGVDSLAPALDAAVDAVSLWSTDGRLLSANERSQRSMQALVGRVPDHIDDLRALLNAGDPARAAERQAAWDQAADGEATESLTVLPLPDGPRLVHVRNTPVRDASGAVSSVLVVSRDVTGLLDELRTFERRRRNGHAAQLREASSADQAGSRTPRPWVVVVESGQATPTLEAALVELGYGVIPAASAAEGLSTLETITPNLILLEAELPATDGAAFRRTQLRQRLAARVPVVVATERRGGLGPEWSELEVAAAVARPFALAELDAALRWALEPGG
jgi:CheY-like chemotaxis protein